MPAIGYQNAASCSSCASDRREGQAGVLVEPHGVFFLHTVRFKAAVRQLAQK
jgi:hypothetical protein